MYGLPLRDEGVNRFRQATPTAVIDRRRARVGVDVEETPNRVEFEPGRLERRLVVGTFPSLLAICAPGWPRSSGSGQPPGLVLCGAFFGIR
jgi:hypothetical protein